MDWFTTAKLGPIPLPYVLAVALFPAWPFIYSRENSLLYFVFVIITVLLKGSLLICWILNKSRTFLERGVLVSGVITLEICVISEQLNTSILPLVVLVPLSNVSGTGIILLYVDIGGGNAARVIIIVSRSSGDEYNWLMSELRTSGRVIPFYITNTNFSDFRDTVSQSTQAILYHSKTRGRLNITDVTDSLYDEEVQYMSRTLGRGNVWAVVDDLEDSSEKAKNDILMHQRTLRDKTHDLFLFTREEKYDKERIRHKLQPLLKTLGTGASSLLISILIGDLLLCVPWLYYIFFVYHGVILILSNIEGSMLLANFLLSFSLGSRQAGLPALSLVVVLELCAVYWYSRSTMENLLLVAQSVSAVLYTLLTSSSAAP